MKAITSMTQAGYELYGKRFISTFLAHGPVCPLHVYTEGFDLPAHEGVKEIKLEKEMPELFEFRRKFAHKKGPNDSYKWQWQKFAGKSFSIAHGLMEDSRMLWFDADVVFYKRYDFEPFFNHYSCFLGRNGFHTETGFLSFNGENPINTIFVERFLDCYESGEVFNLKEWHDCEVYDYVRSGLSPILFRNLTPNAKGTDHVFVRYFYPYMDHLKGPKRKQLGYSPEAK